ncbi:hypothetical protein [Tomitella cavernea]|uniref:Uncharacterized protein n=1 Tax=Tomitella cavernea TaxID=1387982 RepID=A0ABP9CWF9_9ACTN|nr:hypothetical protein [Tomitella cavernea]
MLPDNVVDQIKAVQDVVDGSVAAGGGIQGALNLSIAIPAAAAGSVVLLGSLAGI